MIVLSCGSRLVVVCDRCGQAQLVKEHQLPPQHDLFDPILCHGCDKQVQEERRRAKDGQGTAPPGKP